MAAGRSRWLLPSLLLILAALVGALVLTSSPPTQGPSELEPGTPGSTVPTGPPDGSLRGRPTDGTQPARPTAAGSMGREVDSLTAPELEGRLVVDVRSREGAPISGANVSVRPVDAEGLRGAPFADGDVVAEGVTDADGRFASEAPLPPGRWLRVTASAAGYAAAARVVVARDSHVELVLGPAGEVRVEVLARAEGATAAEPAADVEITLHHDDLRLVATTDAQGRAVFAAAPAGTTALRVVTRTLQAIEDGPFDVPPGGFVERVVVVGPGREVEGVVLDAGDGSPIAGAEVWIARPGASTPAGTTDAQGRFGPAPAGTDAERQFVAVRATGYAPALQPVVLRPADPDGQTVSVEIRLQRAEPWRGRVVGVDGAPAADVRVGWTADGVAGRSPASTTSDEGGWFTIDAPPPPAPGRRMLLVAESAQGRAALALRADDAAPVPLELRLVADPAVGGRLATVDGSAVVGAEVRLVPVWSDKERRTPDADDARRLLGNERGLTPWSAATDAQGVWRVAGIPPGQWQVHARTADLARWYPGVIDVGRRDVDVGTLVVDDGLVLAGRVRDADGRPWQVRASMPCSTRWCLALGTRRPTPAVASRSRALRRARCACARRGSTPPRPWWSSSGRTTATTSSWRCPSVASFASRSVPRQARRMWVSSCCGASRSGVGSLRVARWRYAPRPASSMSTTCPRALRGGEPRPRTAASHAPSRRSPWRRGGGRRPSWRSAPPPSSRARCTRQTASPPPRSKCTRATSMDAAACWPPRTSVVATAWWTSSPVGSW
ncbi:MAG: carboxypeptidase-like regulatory domain-containing protein [Planctomycetota bacterium]